MEEESDLPLVIKTETTEENIDYWINQSFITSELKKQLENANLLLIPNKGYNNIDRYYFPVKTMDFFKYLEENKKDKLNPNICIEDKDYLELALHNEWIIIADTIIRDYVLPLYLNLLGSYIFSIWKNKVKEKKIKFSITVVSDKTNYKIKYDGPADIFEDKILKKIDGLKNE